MPNLSELQMAYRWQEIKATSKDYGGADPKTLGAMLVNLHLIRAFEETVLLLSGEGLINGPAHCSNGQEACAVGTTAALESHDKVNGTHRAHHQFLAKALNFIAPDGLEINADFPADIHTLLQQTLAEIMGLKQGFCGGRGGSMHLFHHDAGMIGTNAIVGGGVPLAAGAAWAEKQSGGDGVVVSFFSDGAANIGAVLETMNLAAAWQLPLCFFIENNQYAVSTSVAEATGECNLSARGPGFGMPSYRVDGMDPLAVYFAMQKASEHMRQGLGPVLIEADTYRFTHLAGSLPGSAFGYRSTDEEAAWLARDPLTMIATIMQEQGLINKSDVAELRVRAQSTMENIVQKLTESSAVNDKRRVIAALWPDPASRVDGVRGDLAEMQGIRTEEIDSYQGELKDRKFISVVAGVMNSRMEEDPRIFTLGKL